jgi:PAS domain S-box-containing protein
MLSRLIEFEKSTIGSLMEEKDKSVAILRSISEPLIILDADYNVELLNRRYEEVFEVSLDEAAGRPFTDTLPCLDIVKKINEMDYKTAEYKEMIVETKIHGINKIFNVVFTPMNYSATGHSAMIVIFHDISELKMLERMRSDFIATISHEFKTPLTSVLMGIDLMGNQSVGRLNTEQKEILQTIQEDSQRLTNLVNELLELSRIESTAMIYNFVPCDINTIIQVSAKQFASMAQKNRIKLSVAQGQKMPRVKADFLKITWVINNLLSNAMKYTKEGDSITIRSWSVGPEVYVSVADTGMGIPKEFIGRIFDKFVQVYGCDIEIRGTGVGLAAAKEIITAHGGDIWCESALNAGSTFTFILNAAE